MTSRTSSVAVAQVPDLELRLERTFSRTPRSIPQRLSDADAPKARVDLSRGRMAAEVEFFSRGVK